MKCNRRTAVVASLAFGAILAAYALDGEAPEPATMKTTRGLGAIVNQVVEIFGAGGAAVLFLLAGGLLAVISSALCPSAKGNSRQN